MSSIAHFPLGQNAEIISQTREISKSLWRERGIVVNRRMRRGKGALMEVYVSLFDRAAVSDGGLWLRLDQVKIYVLTENSEVRYLKSEDNQHNQK